MSCIQQENLSYVCEYGLIAHVKEVFCRQ